MTGNRLEVIATINTQKTDARLLKELVARGATIMRLNGAHVLPREIPKAVEFLRHSCGDTVRVLIDLPGNKIRTSGLLEPIRLRYGERFELEARNFNFESFLQYLREGDVVVSSDGQLRMAVETVHAERVALTALCDGELLNNKGVHLQRGSLADIPFFTDRDRELLAASRGCGIAYVGLSFVRTGANVGEAIALLAGTGITPIVKLETKEGTEPAALEDILSRAEFFLIDRGDLASEVGTVAFPAAFNRTLARAVAAGKRVFVATQLFTSMCDKHLPFLSEVMEFHRLARSGIVGVQLSEEIARGDHPLEVLDLVATLSAERE